MLSKVISFAESSQTLKEIRKNVKNRSVIREVLVVLLFIIILEFLPGLMMEPVYSFFAAFNILQLIELYGCVITIALVFILVTKLEKRSLRSIGFSKNNVASSLLKGFIIGFLMFLAVVVIGFLLGEYRFNGFSPSFSLMLIPFFFGFAVQSFSEEITTRGWVMTYLSKRHSVMVGFFANAIIFVLMHAFNKGFNVIAAVNIFIVAMFLSVLFWKYDNIWICGAFHTVWNFSQGCIFGFTVSGEISPPAVLSFSQVNMSAVGGGVFGLESGLIATFVLLCALAVAYYYPRKTDV